MIRHVEHPASTICPTCKRDVPVDPWHGVLRLHRVKPGRRARRCPSGGQELIVLTGQLDALLRR